MEAKNLEALPNPEECVTKTSNACILTCIWDGCIHFTGTETIPENGGYLEGALAAAKRTVME